MVIYLEVGLDPLYLQTSDALSEQNRQADNSVFVHSMKKALKSKHCCQHIMGGL